LLTLTPLAHSEGYGGKPAEFPPWIIRSPGFLGILVVNCLALGSILGNLRNLRIILSKNLDSGGLSAVVNAGY
jgi:hypothetical protein